MLLREKDRQMLLQIFSSIDEPMKVLAYGSRVTGDTSRHKQISTVYGIMLLQN
jgi:hypothetical protein